MQVILKTQLESSLLKVFCVVGLIELDVQRNKKLDYAMLHLSFSK